MTGRGLRPMLMHPAANRRESSVLKGYGHPVRMLVDATMRKPALGPLLRRVGTGRDVVRWRHQERPACIFVLPPYVASDQPEPPHAPSERITGHPEELRSTGLVAAGHLEGLLDQGMLDLLDGYARLGDHQAVERDRR
jgi:hypothetical protein